MSKFERTSDITVRDIAARKGGEPVVCLTAYTALVAQLLDPHVDLILVGDWWAPSSMACPILSV